VLLLQGDSLQVEVLHPVEDAARLGTRYCTGGFVFQIDDPRYGPLMTGPTYPRSYNLFDGQGIPDAFQPHLPVGEGTVLGIGIGLIDTARNAVTERCTWRVTGERARLCFATRQAAGGYELSLERTLALEGRTLRSATCLANAGKRHVPFQWYPHPFFPVYPGGECCKFALPVTIPENPGYELAPSGFIRMKGLPWTGRSYFQVIGHPAAPARLLQKHPRLGAVGAVCDYVSARLPIWGNENTFSFEPYYERLVGPGEEARWSVTYDF
jgi:hypothetical protein